MNQDRANQIRLRINRIALSQQLDTEELIPKLVNVRIISPNKDVEYIHFGSSKIDRARRLIDCLLNETTERPRNWFFLFRAILLENSSAYSKLVSTLDMTIIRNLESVSTRDEEQITEITFDPYTMNKILIRGSFHKVIDNLPYCSQIPEELFEQLSHSIHSYDQQQFANEQQIFDHMRRLELLISLTKQNKTLSNENFFNIDLVHSFLFDHNHHHYFFKYFYSLSSIYGRHYDRELVHIYQQILRQQENEPSLIIEKGFFFYQFLYNYGRYDYAREIIESIIQILTKQINKQQANIWISLFRSCCALVQIHNQNLEIKEAWARLEAANEIAENLKTIGIEIPNDDYTWFYAVYSQTAYEDANFDACIQYSYRGLKYADKTNHSLIIDLLCTLTQGLIAKWIMNKAQSTAIMTVQYAAKYCGRNTPKYIQALQQLSLYSNEFIQDPSSVELAQYTCNRARTIYGYESLVVAQCYRTLSKSLITLVSTSTNQSFYHPDTPTIESPASAYLHHAYEAYRIAQEWFGLDDRLRLFPYKMTLSHALQARIGANVNENKRKYFDEAMKYLQECLLIAKDIFGSMSFKVAQVHRLQSAVYLSSRMFDAAKIELNICLQIYRLCLPPNSFHYLVTKVSLGLLYKQQDNYQKALSIFENIAQLLDTKTQSFRWINIVLESLLDCYIYFEKFDENKYSQMKTIADQIRTDLYEWRRTHPPRTNLMNFIHQEPSHSLQQFLHESTKFHVATDRLQTLIHLQQNRLKISN